MSVILLLLAVVTFLVGVFGGSPFGLDPTLLGLAFFSAAFLFGGSPSWWPFKHQ